MRKAGSVPLHGLFEVVSVLLSTVYGGLERLLLGGKRKEEINCQVFGLIFIFLSKSLAGL